jgi:hypothetical protein
MEIKKNILQQRVFHEAEKYGHGLGQKVYSLVGFFERKGWLFF